VSQDHKDHKEATASKILWLERGLQAVAYGLLTFAFWSAPQKAQDFAGSILWLLKK
jgi:hypothetical protein